MMSMRTIINGFMGIAVAMLVGCGGGGGGGGSTPPENITLGGTAAKGIIKGGNVVAEELDASGSVIRQVGSATTIADGSYTLTVGSSYGGGPIQVTISADANTEMKCDVPAGCGPRSDGLADTVNPTVIDFSEWYKPGSLTMKALVAEAAANDTIGVSITPYTNLAASRAMDAGSLDAAAVYNANSEVSVLLGGIDILNTKPLDITDVTAISSGNATEVAYAALSAAIATLADTSSGNPDIEGALDDLSTSFSGGVIAASSLQEIIDGASSTLAETGTGDTSGTLAAVQLDVDSAGAGGTVDPEPSPSAGDATLAKVKAFVSDFRTWGTVIEAETKAKGDAFEMQVNLASTAADMSQQFLLGPAFDGALDAIMQNFDGTETSTNLTDYVLGLPGDPQFSSGTISNASGVVTITNGVINGATVNLTVQLPADGSTASSFTLGITSASLRSAASDVDISSGSITFATATPYTVDWAAIDAGTAVEPDITGGSIDLDVSLTQKQNEFDVALASAVTFAGNFAITLTNPTRDALGNINWITPSSLTLAGNVSTAAGESLDASFTVNVTNAATFTPVGELALGTPKVDMVTWSYTDVAPADGTDDTFTLVSPELTLTIQWAAGTATVTESWRYGYVNSYVASGTYASISEAVTTLYTPINWYLANVLYQWVDGEGEYYADLSGADYSMDGSVDGSLVDPEFVLEADATDKWLDGTVGLNFALQLAGLPEASINISGDRTGFESGDATITIAYGVRQIVIDGSFSNTASTGSVTITNQDGVTMSVEGLSDTSTGGDIKFNGTTYGTITELPSGLTKITYSDGTFETL